MTEVNTIKFMGGKYFTQSGRDVTILNLVVNPASPAAKVSAAAVNLENSVRMVSSSQSKLLGVFRPLAMPPSK
jgi:hypothetical protein